MFSVWDTEDFGVVLGVDWYRWYVGISYEPGSPPHRVVVLRFGPLFLHFITR